jgi:type I restriction enzyme S subunit
VSIVLSENLPLLATAAGGIKKLRELILELAVRGKLVQQHANDESADELLKRIAKDRTLLEAQGICKKSKLMPAIDEDQRPFDLPENWRWVRFAQLNPELQNGESSRGTVSGTETIVLRLADISNGEISLTDTRSVIVPESSLAKYQLLKNDILVVRVNGSAEIVGRLVLIDEDLTAIYCDHFIRVRVRETCLAHRFLRLIGDSPLIRRQIESSFVTTAGQKTVNQGHINNLIIPLPPLAEQYRIVAKVDELMILCNRLEAEQAYAESAQGKLVESLLGTLAESTDAADFAANWQRLSEHFDTLFTTESSLDALKQTILRLAVMGKLVLEDSRDTPVSELRKRIANVKERLSKEEGLRTTAEAEISPDEHYVDIPSGWCFERLGNLAKFIDYRGKTPAKIEAGVPLITAKNVRFGFISREPYEFISENEYAKWMTRGFPRTGDILFTTEAPLGNVAVVDLEEKFALAQRVICFQFHEPQIAAYLRVALMSEQVRKRVAEEATGMTATGIKASRLKEIPIPLPPLSEQYRIVAKVDELMALCECLKADIAESRKRQKRLASILIESALKAA